jgi:hypothetical protein
MNTGFFLEASHTRWKEIFHPVSLLFPSIHSLQLVTNDRFNDTVRTSDYIVSNQKEFGTNHSWPNCRFYFVWHLSWWSEKKTENSRRCNWSLSQVYRIANLQYSHCNFQCIICSTFIICMLTHCGGFCRWSENSYLFNKAHSVLPFKLHVMPPCSVSLAFVESILIGRELKVIGAIDCVKENVSISTLSL